MKHDDFLKQVNRELDGLSLPMSEKLKAEPISVKTEVLPVRKRTLKRRLISIGAGALAAGVALVCVLVNLPPVAEAGSVACVRMDINPSVTLVLDEEGKVSRIVSLNADGDTLISDETFVAEVVGQSVENAAKKMAERAAKSGYVDLYANGENGEYNQIQLSFEGVTDLPQEEVERVKNALIDFFKEKGVYVYVRASQSLLEGGVSAFNEWQERPSSFFEYTKTQSGAEGAREAAEGAVYEYTKDILLSSIEKYELFAKIAENNTLIEEKAGVGYWILSAAQRESEELSALALETARLLGKAYAIYGEDYRSVGSITGAVNAAAFEAYSSLYVQPLADEVEALRSYAEGDASIRDFTASEVIEFATLAAASGYGAELLDSLQAMLSFMISDAVTEVEEFVESAEIFLEDWSAAIFERHSTAFDLPRNAIGDEEYEAFLEKIQKN